LNKTNKIVIVHIPVQKKEFVVNV